MVEANRNDGLGTESIAGPKFDLGRIGDWDQDNDGYYTEAEMLRGLFDYFDLEGDG